MFALLCYTTHTTHWLSNSWRYTRRHTHTPEKGGSDDPFAFDLSSHSFVTRLLLIDHINFDAGQLASPPVFFSLYLSFDCLLLVSFGIFWVFFLLAHLLAWVVCTHVISKTVNDGDVHHHITAECGQARVLLSINELFIQSYNCQKGVEEVATEDEEETDYAFHALHSMHFTLAFTLNVFGQLTPNSSACRKKIV